MPVIGKHNLGKKLGMGSGEGGGRDMGTQNREGGGENMGGFFSKTIR